MNLGKVNSIEKMFKDYLSGKTLVSKNGVEFLKKIIGVENVECINNNTVFSAKLELFGFNSGAEEIDVIISLDKKTKGDDIIICPYFSDCFSNSDLPDYGSIIEINEFRKNVENGAFVDSDGCADILLKDDTYVSTSLGVKELADLVYHPKVKAIIWYNK